MVYIVFVLMVHFTADTMSHALLRYREPTAKLQNTVTVECLYCRHPGGSLLVLIKGVPGVGGRGSFTHLHVSIHRTTHSVLIKGVVLRLRVVLYKFSTIL